MTNQVERANLFASLHVKGHPLILFNVWDAGSARAVEDAGAKAIATGSWGVAAAHGYADGENLPLDTVLSNLERIIAGTALPVTLDFEAGYAQNPSTLERNTLKVIATGAIGLNIEDQIIGGEGLYSIEEQCARIRAVRKAADEASVPLFINARTDIFFKSRPEDHEVVFDEAVRRANAFAEAGANGFFAPGLRNLKYIEQLCALSQLPVNILILPGTPTSGELAGVGVARISHGAGPYRQAMSMLRDAGRMALDYE